MKNRRMRVIAVLLVISMFVGSFFDAGMVRAAETERTDQMAVRGDGYCVTIREQNGWEGGFQAEIEVKNTGKEELKNWNVRLELAKGTVANAWNVEWQQEGKRCLFDCQEHNRVIAPGGSATFGCQIEGGQWEDVTGAELTRNERNTHPDKTYEVVYRITDQWDGHANIEAEIFNHSPEEMKDWSVSFDFAGEIESIWNGEIVSHTGVLYCIENKEYNAVIRANSSVTFGFTASYQDGAVTCPEEGTLDYVGAEGPSETEKPAATEKPVETETPSATETPSTLPTVTPSATPEGVLPPEEDEDFDPETDAIVYHDVENRDWNMEMIHADSDVVKKALEHPNGGIRVALLDSGVNYSDEVYVSKRKNFVPGQDDYSELYEDVSGHGTAIAEVLASNPNGTPVEIGYDDEEDTTRYTYYDEEGNVELPEEEVEPGEEPQVEGSLLEILRSGYEWNQGVNPTVDLISAKVLDENDETTVERVTEAIDWAIENDSDIISMSFGMEKDSAKLHKAIKKAYDADILMIAAAGNGDHVEYPAAYPEVMAVGSVDSLAKQAEQSATGEEVEVVAPGEFIVSRGDFDSMQIFSGTSMAVPHVAGLASILWQKDTSKPADFIRQLIDATARECGTPEESGYGLIDCEYALEHYGEFEAKYGKNPKELTEEGDLAVRMENSEEIDTDEEVRKLYGSWGTKQHKAFVSSYMEEKTVKNLKEFTKILKAGTTFVDDKEKNPKCQGMHDNPWFHGYYGKEKFEGEDTKTSNYVGSYYYLYSLACGMYNNGTIQKTDPKTTDGFKGKTELINAYDGINEAFGEEERIGSQTWEQISKACAKDSKGKIPKEERSLILFGMALHTATDTYAHSTFAWGGRDLKKEKRGRKIKWKAIAHDKTAKDGQKRADSTKYVERRYGDAKRVAAALMAKIKVKDSKFLGFKSSSEALDIYAAQNEYKTLLNSKKTIKVKLLKKSYALKRSVMYAEQLEGVAGIDRKALEKATERLSCVALKVLKQKTKDYRYYHGKDNGKDHEKDTVTKKDDKSKENTKSKPVYVLYNVKTGKKLMEAETDTDTLDIIAANDSELRLMKEGEEMRTCCRFSKGRVLDATGLEIPELEEVDTEADVEEGGDGADFEDMCDYYPFEFEAMNVAYRIEMSWEDSDLDLDAVLMAMFPYRDEFYVTCCVEKTERPELGDVFQRDPERASLDQDVCDDAGTETITIHNMEKDGIYLFIVWNWAYIWRSPLEPEKQIAQSGATVRVYRGNETEPCYESQVPQGEGYYWNVFYLFGDTGEIVPIDTITDEAMG